MVSSPQLALSWSHFCSVAMVTGADIVVACLGVFSEHVAVTV